MCHQTCITHCHLPWSQSRHAVQFLRKSRLTLIFSLAGDSLKKLFDSFAQFFTEWHKNFSIILKINSFYLAGFSCWIMFPERTLSVLSKVRTTLNKSRIIIGVSKGAIRKKIHLISLLTATYTGGKSSKSCLALTYFHIYC